MRYQYWVEGQARSTEVRAVFEEQADVLVVGLGTAGAVAAWCAAARGLSVLGVERSTGMGGQGGMSGVVDYYYGTRGGAAEEINARCQALIAAGAYTPSRLPKATEESLPPALKCRCLEEAALEAGARIWYDAQILGVYLEKNRVVGARCVHGDAVVQVGCRVLIDATGEADAVCLAGGRTQPLRAADGNAMSFSLVRAVLAEERWIRGGWQLCGRTRYANAQGYTRALLEAASLPGELCREGDGGRTVFTGVTPGIREGRRIEAEETLSFAAYLAGAQTARPLFYSASLVDNINRDMALEDEAQQDFQLIAALSRARVSVGVPMGALLPRGLEGILVAGRCMGVDHDFSTGVRMKRDMEKSGEAAAAWAFLAVRENAPLRSVKYELLARLLRETGCLDDSQDAPWDDAKILRETGAHVPLSFPRTPEEIELGLASDAPGTALWALRESGEAGLSMLRPWVKAGEETLSRNSALAAGMLGGKFALPKLRAMARDFRQHPQAAVGSVHYPDAMKAIMLLGRMGDAESLPWLMEILTGDAVLRGGKIRPDAYAPEPGDYYANLFLHALCALRRILAAHPEARPAYVDRVYARVFAEDFTLRHSFGRLELTEAAREITLSL